MPKLYTRKLIPSRSECILAGFLAFILSLVGNGKLLLIHYGLISSVQTISSSANNSLTTGLSKLDTYQATTTVVTFIVWAIIGLLTLSIIQAFIHILQQVSFRKEVSSNSYIHPMGFSRKGFWQQLAIQSLGSFAAVAVCSVYVVLFCLYALPIGLLYAQVFWLSFTVFNAGYGFLGIAILFVALLLLDVCYRLLRYRYQLTGK